MFDSEDLRSPEALSATLLAWYDAHRRVLPWREAPTPYRVMLSELMLQQTRVDTVIPYFERFLARWPTLESLAAAEEEEVLTEWAGLGYYSRARNLHKAAREAAARGGLPASVSGLRSLPGIGPYTAGAIASIAFSLQAPLVDGNVERVLSRLDGRREDPRSTRGMKALWARAEELVPAERPGDFNQGLMELGAMVCSPRRPKCGVCPWASVCVARASGEAEVLPIKAPKKKPTPMRGVTGLLVQEGGLWMGRRPLKGLLAGLWEPIGGELLAEEDPVSGLRRVFAERMGLAVEPCAMLGEVVHVFSHRRLRQTVFEVRVAAGSEVGGADDGYRETRCVPLAGVDALALSKLARKTLALGGFGGAAQLGLPLAAEGTVPYERSGRDDAARSEE